MSDGQTVFLAAALSLPLVTTVAIGRAAWCAVRCRKAGQRRSAVLAGLGIVALLAVFGAAAVVWFTYAVAHTGKDATTDLIVLGGTGAAIYVAAFALWRICVFMENKSD